MELFNPISLVFGILLGAFATWLFMRSSSSEGQHNLGEIAALKARIVEKEMYAQGLREDITARDHLIKNLQDKLTEEAGKVGRLQAIVEDRGQLGDSFKALASEALKTNNQHFLELAKTQLSQIQESTKSDLDRRQASIAELVSPVKQSLEKMAVHVQGVEKDRVGAYAALKEQVSSLIETQKALRDETQNLVRALRSPAARGRWGEMQLRRVAEMAGMLNHCDFTEQDVQQDKARPDMIIHLAGGKKIIVDAKVPLEAYLDLSNAPNEAMRQEILSRHASHIRQHVKGLSGKAYWSQLENTLDFVILFLPGENFYSAALEVDPSLIEMGPEHKVLIATPTTLIALLKTIALGWHQEKLAENAREISQLGAELYKRLYTMTTNIKDLGKSIERSVESYNTMIGSYEGRVLVTGRQFHKLQSNSENTLPVLENLDISPRSLKSLSETDSKALENTGET